MKRKIKYIVIHCTATDQNATVQSIQNYWRKDLGWRNPGYHRLIDAEGLIHNLFPFDRVSNGVRGYNRDSIHISYIGGKKFDDRNERQKDAIIMAIQCALDYALPHIPIIQGHRDFGVPKTCPRFDAKEEYLWLRGN